MLVYQRVSGISNRIASGVLKHGREVPFDKEGLFIWENHLTKWDFPLPWSKKNQRVTSIIYCQARKNGLTFPMDELSQLGELTSYVGKTTCSQMKKTQRAWWKSTWPLTHPPRAGTSCEAEVHLVFHRGGCDRWGIPTSGDSELRVDIGESGL